MRNFEKVTRKQSTRFEEFEGKKGAKRNKIVRDRASKRAAWEF